MVKDSVACLFVKMMMAALFWRTTKVEIIDTHIMSKVISGIGQIFDPILKLFWACVVIMGKFFLIFWKKISI